MDLTVYREDFWRNVQGKEYLDSYDSADDPRRKWLARVILAYKPKSVLELGCNVGANLKAIHKIDPGVELAGLDIHPEAIERARKDLPGTFVTGTIYDATKLFKKKFDLVFTCGTLIHIPPESFSIAMDQVKQLAQRDIVHLEDTAPGESTVRKLESGIPSRWVHDYVRYYANAKVLRPVGRSTDGGNHLIVEKVPSFALFYVEPFVDGALQKVKRGLRRLRK